MHGNRDVCNSYDAPGCKHDKHRHGRFSRTAHDTGDTVRKCQEAIEKCFYVSLSGCKFNNLRFIVKCRCKLRNCKKYDHTDNFCKQCRTGNAKIRTFFGPVILFCSEILPDERCERHCKTGDRQKCKSFYFRINTTSRNCHHTKFVDIRLHDDIGK